MLHQFKLLNQKSKLIIIRHKTEEINHVPNLKLPQFQMLNLSYHIVENLTKALEQYQQLRIYSMTTALSITIQNLLKRMVRKIYKRSKILVKSNLKFKTKLEFISNRNSSLEKFQEEISIIMIQTHRMRMKKEKMFTMNHG